MVDGSFRRRRLRPLGLLKSAARVGRVSRHFWEAGRKRWGHLRDGGAAGRDRWMGQVWSGDRGEGVGSEFSQDVVAAAGELAGDRQRAAGVGEPAGFEREI